MNSNKILWQAVTGTAAFLVVVGLAVFGLFTGGPAPIGAPVQHQAAQTEVTPQQHEEAMKKAIEEATPGPVPDILKKDDSPYEGAESFDSSMEDFPLPFGGENSTGGGFKGSLVKIGQRLWKVRFPTGTDKETLNKVDEIYMIYVDSGATIATAQIDEVMTIVGAAGHDVEFYGYQYSDITASVERNRMNPELAFNERFPNKFFASRKALRNDPHHGNALVTFAQQKGIKWRPTHNAPDTVIFAPNNLYMLIVNEPSADMTARNIGPVCGDRVVAQAEACDDGNPIDHDGCSQDCAVQSQYSCSGNPSVCVWNGTRGSLTVSKSITPLRDAQVLGGTLSEPVLRFTLKADDKEAIMIDGINLTVHHIGASVERLELFRIGATTPFAMATVAGCGNQNVPAITTFTNFCASLSGSTLTVARNTQEDVVVRARIKTDALGAVSSKQVGWVKLVPLINDNTAQLYTPIRAHGVTTSQQLLQNDYDTVAEGEVIVKLDASYNLSGANMNVVLSKIASITNASPDPDFTNVPTGIADAGQLKFTAAVNTNTTNGLNTVNLKELRFNLLAKNITLGTTYKLYNKADPTKTVNCSIGSQPIAADTYIVTCTGIDTAGVNAVVPSGGNITLALQVSVTNPMVSASQPSTLKLSLTSYSNPYINVNSGPEKRIMWVDTDAGLTAANTDSRTFFWFDLSDTTVRSTEYGGTVCGNGVIEGLEECDDGNTVNTDDCTNMCKLFTPNPFP